MSKLVLSKVQVIYDAGTANEVCALRGIDLLIEDRDFISVVGSNGCGKSTLLKVVAGIIQPTAGRVYIDRRNVTELESYLRCRSVAFVHQNPLDSCAMGMTVEENLTAVMLKGRRASGRFAPSKEMRMKLVQQIEELGIPLTNKLTSVVKDLSGGQKQVLALTMAVLQQPDILLLDEHTASLDPANRLMVNQLTTKLVSTRQLTTVMVSHQIEDALVTGNRILVMNHGTIALNADETQKRELTKQDVEQWIIGANKSVSENSAEEQWNGQSP